MASEYNADGYTDVRTYVYNNHVWYAIFDDTDTEIVRWDLNSNANVTEVSGPSSNPITYDITITGSDIENAGFTLPVTLEYGKLYETSTSSTPFVKDSYSSTVTVEQSNDEVVITFDNEWPQI